MNFDYETYTMMRIALETMAELCDIEISHSTTERELFIANDKKSSWIELIIKLDNEFLNLRENK